MHNVRGHNASFVSKEPRKTTYTRNRLKKKMCQNPISENTNAYKKQRNECVGLRRQCINQHLAKITEKAKTTNKKFWNFIESFLTNRVLKK